MNEATATRRKREANPQDFQRLLRRLSSDPTQAWQDYDTLRQKLVMFFEHHYRFRAEELAEEVLDRIAKKSESYEITNVAEFAFGVARNLRKEAFRNNQLMQTADVAPDECLGLEAQPEDNIIRKIDSQRKLECFLTCMRRLDAGDRKLLFQYYPMENDGLEERRLRLAEKHQVTMSTLRTRMARLRDKLEECFENCWGGRKERRSLPR
jgi:DNA-directed RNA polymerase specialized sigma24 family protein